MEVTRYAWVQIDVALAFDFREADVPDYEEKNTVQVVIPNDQTVFAVVPLQEGRSMWFELRAYEQEDSDLGTLDKLSVSSRTNWPLHFHGLLVNEGKPSAGWVFDQGYSIGQKVEVAAQYIDANDAEGRNFRYSINAHSTLLGVGTLEKLSKGQMAKLPTPP
jgi:hypothetical protein